MFTINQGFDLNSPQFNFKRDYFASVADLKAAAETNFPDHFITNVAGVLYQLTKSNSVDATTGKWRKVKLGSDVDLSAYAKSADVANTYSKKSETVSNIIEDDALYPEGGGISQTYTFTKADGKAGTFGFSLNGATTSLPGLMSSTDKAKLDGIASGANKYVLPTAAAAALGGIKTGYTTNGKNYKVEVDASGNAFVNVPWTDNQDLSGYAKLTGDNKFTGNNEFDGEASFIYSKNNKYGIAINKYGIPSIILSNELDNIQNIEDRTNNFKLANITSDGFAINGKTKGVSILESGITFASLKNKETVNNLQIVNDGDDPSIFVGSSEDQFVSIESTGIRSSNNDGTKLFATDGSIFDTSTLATTAALATANTSITNLTTTLNNIQSGNKVKSTALPIASTTALGAIKLGTGLTAADDGTVSVSADVVAGSVEWDSVKNKPNVAVLTEGDFSDIAESNGANYDSNIVFADQGTNQYIGVGRSTDEINIEIGDNGGRNLYINLESININDSDSSLRLTKSGITLLNDQTQAISGHVFMTDGTTEELTAITTDELNTILV